MSLDLTALPDYIDQNRDGLIWKTVAGSKSVKVLDLQTGFKGAGAINRIETDVVFQDGSVCGRTPSGTTTIGQRILTPGEIKSEEDICPKVLNKKYMQHQVKAGSKDDAIPFEQDYVRLKVQQINKATEKAIWQGDTLASGDANLNKFDGLIKLIDAEGATVIAGNVGGHTSITQANVIQIVNEMYSKIPADLIEAEADDMDAGNLAILCDSDVFRLYILARIAANSYHYDGENSNLEIMIPGTNVKLMALGGLIGTDRLFAGKIGSTGDFVVGVDLENEEEDIKMWYSDDDKVMKFDSNWKMGTQIKFPDQIVQFTLAV